VIVLGIDPHKKSHTAVALEAATGELLAELTVPTTEHGHETLLGWARGLSPERRFALEDCRHVSGRLERFLIARGESCVRVPPKLMAGARRSARRRGKSDAIDAACVARAALREPDLPLARLEGPEHELRLLCDHRADLVAERTRVQSRLRWHLHDLALPLEVPARALRRDRWLTRLATELAPLDGVQARIARELTTRCRTLTSEIDALEREIAALSVELAPELLELPGCGPLTAACLLGETAGALRFASEARFAMHAGVAPLPVSSGQTQRYRLNRRGNRQLNAALHRIAITQMRTHEPAKAFMTRKRAEGKSTREALRCLKRHLARTVWQTLRVAEVRRTCVPKGVDRSTQPALALAS
jgi:transposase